MPEYYRGYRRWVGLGKSSLDCFNARGGKPPLITDENVHPPSEHTVKYYCTRRPPPLSKINTHRQTPVLVIFHFVKSNPMENLKTITIQQKTCFHSNLSVSLTFISNSLYYSLISCILFCPQEHYPFHSLSSPSYLRELILLR